MSKKTKIKSIFELLDKDKSGGLSNHELKDPSQKTRKKIEKVSPLLAFQLRHQNFNISKKTKRNKGKGMGSSEFEKMLSVKKNKKKMAKPKNNVDLIRNARKNYVKSRDIFKASAISTNVGGF